jgi:hypothetical protein
MNKDLAGFLLHCNLCRRAGSLRKELNVKHLFKPLKYGIN